MLPSALIDNPEEYGLRNHLKLQNHGTVNCCFRLSTHCSFRLCPHTWVIKCSINVDLKEEIEIIGVLNKQEYLSDPPMFAMNTATKWNDKGFMSRTVLLGHLNCNFSIYYKTISIFQKLTKNLQICPPPWTLASLD